MQRTEQRTGGVRLAWSADLADGPHATGRALLRELGAGEIIAVCPRCGGPHGRPRAEGGQVSIAHADGVTLVALGAEHPVGVDLERADAQPPGMTVRRWTEIEAVLKADGRGLEIAPERIRFTGDAREGRAVLDGAVYDLAPIAIEGFVATLALRRLSVPAARAAPATAARQPRMLPHPRRPR